MREKRKTLDKHDEKLKLNKIVKKQKLQEQGITLIALVVTIIILLILAGVTLNIALSDNGLFSKAKKAAEDYKEAQSEEEDSIRQIATQMYSEYVGATVTGYELDNNKTVTITSEQSGVNSEDEKDWYSQTIEKNDDGTQTFETEEMTWKIWDFDGNILRIIGNPTKAVLALKGVAGYNNGTWAIDHICEELYGNGKSGVSATNLKRTDIQNVSTYDYTNYKHKPDSNRDDTSVGDSSSIYFGSKKTYENNNKYPEMWEINDKNWNYEYDDGTITDGRDKECKKWELVGLRGGTINSDLIKVSSETVFKQSYYYHAYNKNEFVNSLYYDLIFGELFDLGIPAKHACWLSGRYTSLGGDYVDFGHQFIRIEDENGVVGGYGHIDKDRKWDMFAMCSSSNCDD